MRILISSVFLFFAICNTASYEVETVRKNKKNVYLYKKVVVGGPYHICFSTNALSRFVFFTSLCEKLKEKTMKAFVLPLLEFPGRGASILCNNKLYLCVGDSIMNFEEQLCSARLVFDAEEAIKLVKNSIFFKEDPGSDPDIEEVSISYESSDD